MLAQFDQFISQPENTNRNYEWIAGRIVEKVVSNSRASTIGALMAGVLVIHVQHRKLGYVTGADGGYVIGGEKYIPDAAYVSNTRQSQQPIDP